jgi:uncharacterized protein (TIGR02996 family)
MFDATPRPELLALLAAVKAEPEDDTAKLVLADWLEEQDLAADRARGEFLRTLVDYESRPAGDPEFPALAYRLNLLWQQYREAWVGPLMAAGLQFMMSDYRGGLWFPRIDGTQAVAKKAAEVADSEAYAWVGGLTFGRLSSQQNRQFIHSSLLASLIALRYDECRVESWAIEELAHAAGAARLKRLEIRGVRVGHIAGEAIASSPYLSRLRHLELDRAQLSDAGFKALCDSPHLNELRSLSVSNDSLSIHAARAFSDATGLPALTELDIGGTNRIGPDGTLILVHKPAAGRLRKLNLWSNGVADYGVEAICNQKHMDKLTHLDVSGNLLTNRAAVAIAAAEHLQTLENLNLRTNGISGEGALALADAPHLANLRRLDLGGNRIGAKAADRLRERFGNRVVLE